MICLDSTFIIDFLRGKEEAVKKMEELRNKKVFTTSITEYEIMLWEYLHNLSNDKIEKAVSLLNSIPIYNFDTNAALSASLTSAELIKKGKEIEESDCMILGIILSNGCNEIISNDNHFKRINELKVINY